MLKDMGGPDALLERVKSDYLNGINVDNLEKQRRINCFGDNKSNPPEIHSFWFHLKDAAN